MKTWIKTNFYKITSILALFLATTGLIIGSISHHKTDNINYFLNHDYTITWGGATIWSMNLHNEQKINLYFDIKKRNVDDVKWDGVYPNGYFDN